MLRVTLEFSFVLLLLYSADCFLENCPISPSSNELKWGDFEDLGCTGCGLRDYRARLWNIAGGWEETCAAAFGKPVAGGGCILPTTCVKEGWLGTGGMWGHFKMVKDDSCKHPYWAGRKDEGCSYSNPENSLSQQSPPVTIGLTGSYHWELLFDIDNSENSGHVLRSESYKVTKRVSYKGFRKAVTDSAVKSSLGLEVGGVVDIVKIGVTGSMEAELRNTIENLEEQQTETNEEYTKTTEIKIGPNSKFKLYRLVFQGPGITYVTDTLSSTPHPKENITIDCTAKKKVFLKDIQIVYTDQKVDTPSDAIQELNSQIPDINYQFSGKFVWLVPTWTTNENEGIARIQFIEQYEENRNYKNLAEGSKGTFRYLRMLKDGTTSQKITGLALFRHDTLPKSLPPVGYDYCTTDINQNRKKTFLYLCWQVYTIQGK